LDNLKLIGGNLFCSNSELNSLEKLNSIHGTVYMEKNAKLLKKYIEGKVGGMIYG